MLGLVYCFSNFAQKSSGDFHFAGNAAHIITHVNFFTHGCDEGVGAESAVLLAGGGRTGQGERLKVQADAAHT